MALTTILEEQTLSFDESGTVTNIKPNFLFAIGETYTVIWDGVNYEREAAGIEEEGVDFAIPYIGNASLAVAGEEDNGDPFLIYLASPEAVSIVTSETGRSHTVSIYTDTNALLPVQFLFPFALSEAYGAYVYTISPAPVIPVVGETYIVEWDGKSYTCVGQNVSGMAEGAVGLGNLASFGGDGNDEPFIIGYIFGGLSFLAFDAELSHTVGIYQGTADEGGEDDGTEAEQEGIITYDRNGNPVAHYGIETLTFDTTTEGKQQKYTKGIKTEKTVELFLADGDQTVEPDEGTLLSKVTIAKPETLVPENIAKDVYIAGIGPGTHSAEISLEGDFLKYVVYQIDMENKVLTVTGILYGQLYADTGGYEVTIPDTFGDFSVEINSEGVV